MKVDWQIFSIPHFIGKLIIFVALALVLCDSCLGLPRSPTELYAGEEIIVGGGFPALTKFEKGADATKPLIVFIPGAAHLARIGYGCTSCDARDFPAYWLVRRGFSFLAISYPLAHPIYSRTYPEFTVRDWGRQAAEITRTVMVRRRLGSHVVLVGWSMGGKVAEAYNEAATGLGIEVDFFVALAATPPLPNFVPGILKTIKRSSAGLVNYEETYERFLASLEAQDALNGHNIIPRATYLEQFLGAFPVNLLGTQLRYRNGEFVADVRESEIDTGAFEYAHFPLAAMITGASALDARHALTDESAWGMYAVQKVYQDYVVAAGVLPEGLSARRWHCLRRTVARLPRRLSRVEEGTHFLFVGAKGARAITADIESLTHEVSSLKREVAECVGKALR